ncbi:energy transducer TonB [Gluconobacter sp. NFX36]|uniref:energy transducer TonB n=1 Tax=Gluconobacter TaxID=441 RepID=UPI003CEA62E5
MYSFILAAATGLMLAGSPNLPENSDLQLKPGAGTPEYPIEAFEHGETAKTEVSCDISEAGTPSNCHIAKSNNPHFNASALEFVQRMRYVPARRNGKNIAVPNHIEHVDFTI